MGIIERYCRTEYSSYEDFFENFTINVPDEFNFAYDVVDEWARTEPDKRALVWCDDNGAERTFTFSEISRESNRRKVRDCVALCDVVTLRDKDSLEELKSLGVTREDMVITGDPVFTLAPPESQEDTLSVLGIEHPNGVIGISVRSIPDMTDFPREFAAVCDRLIRERGKAIVFLIMQESIDEPISRAVQQLMTEPSYIRKTPGDLPSMLSLIRGMDAIIAMRLHTIIFAANVNVPVVGCNYDPKVASMLDILGLPSCGTPTDMTADSAYNVCCEMLDNLPQYKASLAQAVQEQTRLAESTAKLFNEMLSKYHID